MIISFNESEKIISFEELFKRNECCRFLPNKAWLYSIKEIDHCVIPTVQENLKIVDTQIPIPGSEKTLKFYVEKKVEQLNGKSVAVYNYWPKNVRALSAALHADNHLSHILKINDVSYPVFIGKGSYNTRSMVSIGSTHFPSHQSTLYSVSVVNENHYEQEFVELNKFVSSIKEYLTINKKQTVYLNCLALPSLIKQRTLNVKLGQTSSIAVYTKMLNGKFGNLDQIIQQNNVKYQIEHIKQAYEGLLLLFAAGFSHDDIKPKNIVKNDHGFLLIDFAFSKRLKREKIVLKGTPAYMSPKKYLLKDTEYNSIGNDLYAFCLSFIFPYLNINRDVICYTELNRKYQSSFEKEAFYTRIDNIYFDDEKTKKLLKQMFLLCISLSEEMSIHKNLYSRVTFFVARLARGVGIKDGELLNKAVLNSTCSELEKNQDVSGAEANLPSEITHYVSIHPQLDIYINSLSFNRSIEYPTLELEMSDETKKYQVESIKQAYEGLLLLFAAGFFHGDITPENIAKKDRGFSLIDARCGGKIQKQRFDVKGTPAFISAQKYFAANCEYCPVENDLYGFCLSFISPYIKKESNLTATESLFDLSQNQIKRAAFYEEIDKSYSANDSLRKVLKKMFHFCLTLSSAGQPGKMYHIRPIAFHLSNLAWSLGIKDVELVEKAVANSMCTKQQQKNAMDDFKENVSDDAVVSAFFLG